MCPLGSPVSLTFSQAGGRESRCRIPGNPKQLGEKKHQPLTSSEYWTSSTAYFSLKCSLEWILKGKHRECHSQGLAMALLIHLSDCQIQLERPSLALPSPGQREMSLPITNMENTECQATVTIELHLPPQLSSSL